MVEYAEALLKQRVWHWLEEKKGMSVDGEINIGSGRIDLIGEKDGEVWGIEVKTGGYRLEQVDRYIESKAIDRLYLASGNIPDPNAEDTVDYETLSQTRARLSAGLQVEKYTLNEVVEKIEANIEDKFLEYSTGESGCRTVLDYVEPHPNFGDGKNPITLKKAIRRIRRSFTFPELGLIQIPKSNLREEISPGAAPDPEIIRTAGSVERDRDTALARREEPWIRHRVWQEYGGIPEGHIPSVLDTDNPYRPIDLIAFEGSSDPTDAMENPENNKIIGIEVKGEGSYNPSRLSDQLDQFLQTSTLSNLYIAIPSTIQKRATKFISESAEFADVGIITVSVDGSVNVVKDAINMKPEYDGYFEKNEKQKVGFGDADLEWTKEVISPYVTTEEADRLRFDDPMEYANGILCDNSDMADKDGYIQSDKSGVPRESPNKLDKDASGHRSYIVTSDTLAVVDKYELKLEYYCEEDILFLKTSGTSAALAGDELNLLQSIITSIEYIEGGGVSGFDIKSETKTNILIKSHINKIDRIGDDGTVITFQLGNSNSAQCIDLTRSQWIDFISTIDILRKESGKTRELPGPISSYPYSRITPSGDLVENDSSIRWERVIR